MYKKASINEHSCKFEHALQRYVDAYMNQRDPGQIKELLADQFCGFGTGEDEFFTDITEGMNIFQRDIATAPKPLVCALHKKSLQKINDHHAIATLIFDLKTEITGQGIKLKKLRLMIAFIEIEEKVKVSGMHVSFPSVDYGADALKRADQAMYQAKNGGKNQIIAVG